jgi:hypothetical protein
MENFGRIALHPRAETGGHDEDEGCFTTHVFRNLLDHAQ